MRGTDVRADEVRTGDDTIDTARMGARTCNGNRTLSLRTETHWSTIYGIHMKQQRLLGHAGSRISESFSGFRRPYNRS